MATVKTPKSFNKMNLDEQEAYLVKKYKEADAVLTELAKMLAKVRGGQRLQIKEVERPDEAILKQ